MPGRNSESARNTNRASTTARDLASRPARITTTAGATAVVIGPTELILR